jgi:hypothetical protein
MPRLRGTAEQRQRLTELHAKGLGRNSIARELDCSVGHVTNMAQDLGLSFDRTSTEQATAARRADLAERRTRLEGQLLEDAERLRGQVWASHEYIDHGGKDFVQVRWVQDEPTPSDKLKLMQAAGVAIDRSLKIAATDAESGDGPVTALLVNLGRALGVIPDEREQEPGEPEA